MWLKLPQCFQRISSSPHSENKICPLQPCFFTNQNFTVFENGHPRNISAKFSWNSPNTFREDDFTPHKSTTCRCQQLVVIFKQIKISLTIFEKGQPRNISEIISKSDQPFQWRRNKKFFLSPCSANKSSQPEPWLYTDNNFVNSFWKGSRKEYFCELF